MANQPQPNSTSYDPAKQSGTTYGLHVPYDKGYDAQAGPHKVAGATDSWNARFIDQYGQTLEMWIETFETGFSIEGTTAQSRSVRQFYPRSFSMPVITVTGRVANTYEFNRLASFGRTSQIGALNAQSIAATETALGQNLQVRHFSNGTALPTVALQLRGRSPWPITPKRGAKGGNIPWHVEGFIKNIQGGATAQNVAPQFSIDFYVGASDESQGIYGDSLVTGHQILSWAEVFKNNWSGGYTTDPDTDASAAAAASEIAGLISAIF